MTRDHERYADWDAAYVLGALSPADRREFEEHLEGCARCREAVAELAPIPGLLGRLDAAEAERLLDPVAEQPVGSDLLVARVRRDGRRRARVRVALVSGLAAAAVVAGVVAIPLATGALRPSGDETVALEPVGGAPIEAAVTLDERGWGTRLDLDCSYPAGGAGSWRYALVVTGRDGAESEVSTWRIEPGDHARLSAATALSPDEIAAVEIRDLGTGATVMRAEL